MFFTKPSRTGCRFRLHGPRREPAPWGETSSLLSFFVLTYVLMWACFFTVAFGIPARSAAGQFLLRLGAFAPGISALCLSARAGGRPEVEALLRPILKWRVSARWYLFALVYIAAIKIAVAVIHRVVTGGWPRFGTEGPILILVAILISTPFQGAKRLDGAATLCPAWPSALAWWVPACC